jgi:hypothetical protein
MAFLIEVKAARMLCWISGPFPLLVLEEQNAEVGMGGECEALAKNSGEND